MRANPPLAGRFANPGSAHLSCTLAKRPARIVASMASDPSASAEPTSTRGLRRKLAVPLTSEAFRPFGQVKFFMATINSSIDIVVSLSWETMPAS